MRHLSERYAPMKAEAAQRTQHMHRRFSELYARIEHTGEQTAEGRGRRLTRPASPIPKPVRVTKPCRTWSKRYVCSMRPLPRRRSLSMLGSLGLLGCIQPPLPLEALQMFKIGPSLSVMISCPFRRLVKVIRLKFIL